ncbi:hypothetical protein [Jannaschia rubra]|nr:hypothetical protein [Jannaschia rubra]
MEEQQTLNAEEIVHKAFDHFQTFVSRGNPLGSVLLEGLEPDGSVAQNL